MQMKDQNEQEIRKQEMERKRELDKMQDRKENDQVVGDTRAFIFSRGKKNEEGWATSKEENLAGRHWLFLIENALRAIEADKEERHEEKSDPEMVDLAKEEEKKNNL